MKNDDITIDTTDGFELTFKRSELIKVGDSSEKNHPRIIELRTA